eukprot:CAMPEP_0177609356 /NCGR_PEP_ID=MMETSP0419_2-20121207/19033_1 /TAXON_ID=582737 /ORGANISM="Tetraselmis sp., Strain GSL018" /LENGTH=261 /DNA_ID=CAMNT_0019104251 /DNA_START=17 /DNA_END=802 /DNA_ORIENTATION=+
MYLMGRLYANQDANFRSLILFITFLYLHCSAEEDIIRSRKETFRKQNIIQRRGLLSENDNQNSREECQASEAVVFKHRPNFSCKDENAWIFRDVTKERCEAQCSCRRSCVGYTYNEDRGDCYLKESCDLGQWDVSELSGFKARQDLYSEFENLLCTDETLKSLEGSSRDECRSECTEDPRCGAFSLRPSGLCVLKRSCGSAAWTPDDYSEIKAVPPSAMPSEPETPRPSSDGPAGRAELGTDDYSGFPAPFPQCGADLSPA